MQAALAVRAMRGVMTGDDHVPLRSLHTTFVGPLPGGCEIQVRAEQLRVGRNATHARCDLMLDGAVACTAVGVFGIARPSPLAFEIPRPAVGIDPESLPDWPEIAGKTPGYIKYLRLRTAAGGLPFTGYHEPRSTMFAKLRDSACTPEDALIALADSIPPPALSMLRGPGVASSMNWMLELLGDPAGLPRNDWALIDTHVRAGSDGYMSQTSVLWGPAGHAFSVSHQTVGVFG
jgi:acyl-CoA thioesterase